MAQQNNGGAVLAPYWEKFSIWACSAIIALLCIGYQDQKTTIDKMEERVQFLMLDKVSKNDLKEVETRIMNRIEAGNENVLSRIELLKQFISEAKGK